MAVMGPPSDRSRVELGKAGPDPGEPGLCFVDHRGELGRLRLEQGDLAFDPFLPLAEVDPALGGVVRLAEPLAVACAGGLVLEELADLGQREPGIVTQAADEEQAIEVGRVVQAIVAIGSAGRLEQSDLLVVADRAGRQAGLGRDFVDLEEAGRESGWAGFGHGSSGLDHSTTFTFT